MKAYDYYMEFKSKNKPEFENWIKNGIDEKAVKWTNCFAKYLSLDTDYQRKSKDEYYCYKKSEKNKKDCIRISDIKSIQNDEYIIGNDHYKLIKRTNLTSSKLRKFYGHLKKLELKMKTADKEQDIKNILNELNLLKPKLAYDVGREKDQHHKLVDFYQFFSEVINHVKDKIHFNNFIQLLECIVAYFKVHENEIIINA